MSDKNINIDEFDLMMKSILDEAREEVPERVWEGVSVGLDKAARRKTVVLWFRRAAVGVAAAAAVVFGVFFTHDTGNEFVPAAEDKGMIAVVEPEAVAEPEMEIVEDGFETYTLVAEAEDVTDAEEILMKEAASAAEALEISEVSEDSEDEDSAAGVSVDVEDMVENESVTSEIPAEVQETEEVFEDWGEQKTRRKRDVSLVLSGLASTNNALSQNALGPMMRPTLTPAPKKTGIEETSVKSSYGIPLSAGAGVKIGLGGRWSVGAGLNYTYLSRQFYGKYTKVADDGSIEKSVSSDISNRQHYIGIPVNVFYDVISNDRIDFYAYAGGTAEKCVGDSYSLLKTDINHDEKVKGVQLSANAGIGVEFMLGKSLGLYIDPSVRYYFRNDSQPKSIRTVQPLMLGFEMGLRARL